MSIILNEQEWAKEMIASRSLGKKPFETLTRVARYYIDNNYSKRDTRNMLDTFLLQCDNTASLPKWSDTLDYALDRALKHNAVEIDGISVTKPEMAIIDELEGTQIRRLAFTLLCVAKYHDIAYPASDHWVSTKDSDIMRMANINTSIKRQCLMYHSLRESDLIQFSKRVDNTNVRVCFMSEGETSVKIADFRNLGYQYLRFHGGSYFECVNCGITVKKNDSRVGRPQKYCKSCAQEIAAQQKINSIRRTRNIAV